MLLRISEIALSSCFNAMWVVKHYYISTNIIICQYMVPLSGRTSKLITPDYIKITTSTGIAPIPEYKTSLYRTSFGLK